MSNVSEEIREIEQEIAKLYRKKRLLEMQQQREWEELYPPFTAKVDNSEINYDYLIDNVLWG
jgi:hypothetical protein